MKIRITGIMLNYVGYRKDLECDATTLGGALDQLCADVPVVRPIIFTGAGTVSRVHRLVLNGELINNDALDHPLRPDDVLELITATAGG
jgi:hypothetical protein